MRTLLVLAALAVAACGGRTYAVEVCAAGVERIDPVAEVALAVERGVTLRRVDGEPVQTDLLDDGRTATTFQLAGRMAADECRTVEMVEAAPPSEANPSTVSFLDNYRGEAAFRITTPTAAYVYHVGGSGFASLFDRDRNDWISYRPEGGFEGDFRGIPNIAPPDFHAGRPAGKKRSRILSDGPLKTTILSETEDGQWRLRWDFFPAHARMTLLSKGPEPYWILYEGTPGGRFDPSTDYWFNSRGERMPMPEPPDRWNGRLPDPQWVCFGDSALERVLFLALHEADDQWDEFWHRGPGGMTVFGFGRGPRPQWQYLRHAPAHLTMGFVETDEFPAAKRAIESAWRPLDIRVR